jgi:ATP-dependent RNA helicase DDX31/DBP7
VSAYAVHAAETKHVFILRELHFGHVAKSFALKEVPTKITYADKEEKKDPKKRDKQPATTASKTEQYEFKQEEKELRTKRLKKVNTRTEFEA